jgi:hypothetical protein
MSHLTVYASYATEMLRLGVSLPALSQLQGHKDIAMTMRYLQVTQQDLQREFHQARQNAPHSVPALSVPEPTPTAGLPSIHQALAATRHLLEMYRRSLPCASNGADFETVAYALRGCGFGAAA